MSNDWGPTQGEQIKRPIVPGATIFEVWYDGQFIAKDNATHCDDCHNSTRWVPSTFDHDTRTHLPLTGGHANVLCNKCHTKTKLVEDKEVVIYKKTPNKCVDCHGDNPKIMQNAPST